MIPDDDAPKNEFANFLEDIAGEISERVGSLPTPPANAPADVSRPSEETHILDWPSVIDRMIDEMR